MGERKPKNKAKKRSPTYAEICAARAKEKKVRIRTGKVVNNLTMLGFMPKPKVEGGEGTQGRA